MDEPFTAVTKDSEMDKDVYLHGREREAVVCHGEDGNKAREHAGIPRG